MSYRYRYEMVADPKTGARHSLSHCPVCNADLTEPAAIYVDCEGGNSFESELDDMGILNDPDGIVFEGLHGHTDCNTCGEMLIEMHGIVETNLADLDDVEGGFEA